MSSERCPDPYGAHPDAGAIITAGFNGYQGISPTKARVLVLGLDANWPCDMLSIPVFWDEVKHYLKNPVAYWKSGRPKYPASCVDPIHHPLISEARKAIGGKWNQFGTKYHHTFNTQLRLDSCHADCLTFLELLNIPTYGSTTAKGGPALFKKLLLSAANAGHVKNLNDWLFNPSMKDFKLVLLSRAVLEEGLKVLVRAIQMKDPFAPPVRRFCVPIPAYPGCLEFFIINDKTLWCRHTHFSAQSGAIGKEAPLLRKLIAVFCDMCSGTSIDTWFPKGITEEAVRGILG